jgi:hypothetical protein
LKGTGFSVKGTGFSVKGTGFSVKGTGFSVKGTGFSPYKCRAKTDDVLQTPEKLHGRGTKCQGTTSVVPKAAKMSSGFSP